MKPINRNKAKAPYNAQNVYLERPRMVMKFLGVWLPAKDESTLHKLYRIFMVSLQYLFLTFHAVYIFQVWGDFDELSQALYQLFPEAFMCFRVTVFLVNEVLVRQLLDVMDSELLKPESEEHERIHKFQASRIKRLLLMFAVSSEVTIGLYGLKPLLDDHGSREFPIPMWMPVGPERSPQYELGYGFQVLTLCAGACIFYGVDSVALSMVIFGCAQIDVIKDKLLSIKGISMQDRSNMRTVKKLHKENYKKLVDCIKQHQTIAKFIAQTENAYHSYLLFTLSGSVGLICLSAVRLMLADWGSMQFVSILLYLSVMIVQMYVCCWCGHEITAKSEELFVVLYECPWYEQNVVFKRALHLAMLRMSRPLVFRAGHYVALSRQTFVAVLRMSYSYFAVLRQTQNH